MQGEHREQRRSRRRRVATVVVLVVVACGLVPSPPAAAAPAPLVTEDAIGIRVDETAFGPELVNDVEASLEPTVLDLLTTLAEEHAPSPYHDVTVEAGVDLAVDFHGARAGAPDGGIALDLDIEDIGVTYVVDPPWPFRRCQIEIRPDDGQIAVDTDLDLARMPASPLALTSVDATWDERPSVRTTGPCFLYLLDDFLRGWRQHLTGSGPTPIGDTIEERATEAISGAIAATWEEQVAPILEPLSQLPMFSWGRLYADDHGIIVTLDADGTGGLVLPGLPISLPVIGAQDTGSVTDPHELLARRPTGEGDMVVTIHPNIANQFLFGFNLVIGGALGSPAVLPLLIPSLEDLLLPPELHEAYPDDRWFVRLRALNPIQLQARPGLQPVGSLPLLTAEFRNSGPGLGIVSTYTGSVAGLEMDTAVRDFVGNWGPVLEAGPAEFTATRTFANADASLRPAADDMEVYPFVQRALDDFIGSVFERILRFGPLRFGAVSFELCDICAKHPDDDRYTETFVVP